MTEVALSYTYGRTTSACSVIIAVNIVIISEASNATVRIVWSCVLLE